MPRKGTATAEAPDEVAQPVGDDGEKPAKQQIREAFEAGKSRSDIAKEFGVTYQRVYQLTKDLGDGEAAPRARVTVEESEKITEAGRTDLVGLSRVEAIRKLFDEGMKLGDIARLLGTSYQVCFQATKSQRAGEAPESDADSDAPDGDADETDEDDEDEDAELAAGTPDADE
jgi:transposase